MSIRRLLDDERLPIFLGRYYQVQPFALKGGASELCGLGSWEVLAEVLARPNADTMAVRRNRHYEGPPPASAEEALRLFAEGYTLLVRHAERHHAGIGELARGVAADLASAVNVHLYYTPADQFGFSWHYDAEEVFIVQTAGSKEYSLRKNTMNPWPLEETLPTDMRYEREISPLMKCRLSAGDWLYIPAGWWHRGEATEAAISLAVGVMPRTGVDLFDLFRERVVESFLWRQRLPVVGQAAPQSEEELTRELQMLLQRLGDDFTKAAAEPAFMGELLRRLRST